VRSFTVAERRNRLGHRHFLGTDDDPGTLVQMTAALIGWHATDPATPYLSLQARLPGFSVADLDRELYQKRSVVKHLAMRRTLWLVTAAALPVLQPGSSDRVADNERRRLIADVERAGVAVDGAKWLDDACAAVLRHLDSTESASTNELRSALTELTGTYDPAPGKRWGGETHLAPRVLTVAAASGDIVRGPNQGTWTISRHRWVGTERWLGTRPVPVTPGTARDDLIRAWLWAFGPATITDIRWWFGTTLTAVRQGLADIGAVEVDVHGTPGWVLADDLDPTPPPKPWAALLPGLDVTTMGWSQRAWYLGEHRPHIFDRNGNGGPTAWWNGRIVGGWNQDGDGRVRLQLVEDPGRTARTALTRKADELTDWLAGTRISPRFPSPLSKAAR